MATAKRVLFTRGERRHSKVRDAESGATDRARLLKSRTPVTQAYSKGSLGNWPAQLKKPYAILVRYATERQSYFRSAFSFPSLWRRRTPKVLSVRPVKLLSARLEGAFFGGARARRGRKSQRGARASKGRLMGLIRSEERERKRGAW